MVTFTFEQPQYLWFLFALPLLVVTHFFLLRHAKRKALMFANFAALKRATGERYITKNYTILAIRTVIILCMVFAVAQTSMWYDGDTNENEYVIALDTSASMAAEDIPPTRLDAAKDYAGGFIDALDSQTRVGLVSFSGITFIEQPLTQDRGKLAASLEDIEIEASGTDIPGSIITSTNLLVDTERGRAMIIITDGSNTIESFESRSMQRAIDYAISKRVKIFAVGVGSNESGPIGYLPSYYNVSTNYNAENLLNLANATGGAYYAAQDAQGLSRAYESISASQISSTLDINLTPGLVLLTLMLILIEWGLINTRFRMIP